LGNISAGSHVDFVLAVISMRTPMTLGFSLVISSLWISSICMAGKSTKDLTSLHMLAVERW
jgi:hypothetical protein